MLQVLIVISSKLPIVHSTVNKVTLKEITIIEPEQLKEEVNTDSSHLNVAFSKEKSLAINSQNTPSVKSYICAECGYAAAQKGNLKRHKESEHMRGKHFNCDQCAPETYFNSSKSLLLHITNCHSRYNQFKCEECSFSSHREDVLEAHIKEVHKTPRSHLCFCGYAASQKGLLDHHLKYCTFIQ